MRKPLRLAILTAVLGGFVLLTRGAVGTYGDVTTFLGGPVSGDGGAATSAILDFAEDVAVDGSGILYIADTENHAIRKVATDGTITMLAGGGFGASDGTGSAATFAHPRGVAVDASGNVYVADTGNDAVRKVTAAGVVTTLVNTGLSGPYGVSVNGSTVYIVDSGNNALKSVSSSGGAVTTVATGLNDPRRADVTNDGTVAYVADNGSHRVLRVTLATGTVALVAGSGTAGYAEGTGASAQFENVWGVALSNDEATLFVSDHDLYLTDRIRAITLSTGTTTLFAGDQYQSEMIFPAGMAVTGNNLYVAMSGLGTVRRYHANDASNTAVVAGSVRFGDTDGVSPSIGRPTDLALTTDRQSLFLAINNKIRKIDIASASTTTVIGSVVDNYRDGVPVGPGVTTLEEARFSGIAGIVVNGDGTALYVTDRWNNRVRKVDLTASPVASSLVSGAGRKNGTGETTNGYQEGTKCTHEVDRNDSITLQSGCAYFEKPAGLVLDPTETYLYVADSGNARIRKVRIADGVTTLVAGGERGFADGVGAAAQFATPWGLALSLDGTTLYVADRGNHRIRAIALATNTVTTLAGAGTSGYDEGIGSRAYFSLPKNLKMGADGFLYLSEAGSHRVRQIDPATGLTKLVAGSGERGFLDGAKADARFNDLEGLAPDTAANVVYVADSANDVIRRIDIEGDAPYADPSPTVTKVVPDRAAASWAKNGRLAVSIRGTGFRHGAIAKFYTFKAKKTYVVSGTRLTADIPVNKMSPGWYDITVTNTDGQFDVLEAGFGLTDPITGQVPDTYYTFSEIRGFYGFKKSIANGASVASGNVRGDGRDEVILGSGLGRSPIVRIFEKGGTLLKQFAPYKKSWRTGVQIASCDLDGDGIDEIVTAPGVGKAPRIRAFTGNGVALATNFLALDRKFSGGVTLACGDITGDGNAEIVVAPLSRGGASASAYSAAGTLVRDFTPFGTRYKKGITVAVGDLTGDGIDEVLFGMERGARVLAFSGTGVKLSVNLRPYGRAFTGGISVASGDTNDDGKNEIIVAPRSGRVPEVRVYAANGTTLLSKFNAYPKTMTAGVLVASGDVNGNGIDDIVTVPHGRATAVRMYDQDGTAL